MKWIQSFILLAIHLICFTGILTMSCCNKLPKIGLRKQAYRPFVFVMEIRIAYCSDLIE